ncbi:hypothetical protein C2G38_908963 [Gigaspora rosea]|uniref:F-box domain-containing protein n=1 Tax=Gigaspora rosea TaxID=44941 RepID=A0A397W6F2_9GLOM|nr:hypothetical protein C2G38_908963 [Gigaspora rosea]
MLYIYVKCTDVLCQKLLILFKMIKLPNECLFIVFNNLKDDSKSLYSSLLVNRQLCKIIAPILWSNMTSKLNRKKIINTCLLTLNAEEQALLIPFKIPLPNYPKPLFEYTSYTTSIDSSLNCGVVNWLNKNGHEEIQDRWDSNFNYIVNAVKYSLITMFLRTNKRLEYLEIVGFIDSNNKLIFKNLCRNNTIISLYLYNNRVDSEGIAEIFEKNTTLTSLNIKSKKFDLNGVKVLANALHINTTLASLKLNYENIDIEGGKALTKH